MIEDDEPVHTARVRDGSSEMSWEDEKGSVPKKKWLHKKKKSNERSKEKYWTIDSIDS